MKWQEYLKSPIYEKYLRIIELRERLNPYQKLEGSAIMRVANSPAFQQMEKVALIYEAFEPKFESYRNFLEENHLLVKEKQVKPLVKMYRKRIENEYGIDVQFDKYFYDSFGEMPIDEFLELIEDEGLLRHLMNYADEENQKFNRLAKAIGKPEKSPKKEPPKTFEELFDSPEKLAFVEKMLKDEGFYFGGRVFLGEKERFKIAALCDALQVKKVIPKMSDKDLHRLFASKMSLTTQRFSRRPDAYKMAYNQYIKYIEGNYRPVTPRNAPK